MIIFTMAGLSARFSAAGYEKPKYMLPLGRETVFDRAVAGFSTYFDNLPFLFVYRGVAGTADFLAQRIAAMGIRTAVLARLDAPTRGQAETAALGIAQAGVSLDMPITLFNIDTFRPGFTFPVIVENPAYHGYLEVFEGEGENWSFIRPDPRDPTRVSETAEKRAISRLCCTGLYHFSHASDFLDAFETGLDDPLFRGPKDELYVAPLYNHLIRQGRRIGYVVIPREQVVFCGVPVEYEELQRAEVVDRC